MAADLARLLVRVEVERLAGVGDLLAAVAALDRAEQVGLDALGGDGLAVALLAAGVAACGGDDEGAGGDGSGSAGQRRTAEERTGTERRAAPARRPGPLVTVRDSRFGRMLFDRRGQALYLFARDGRGPSRCYGACAEAWPPFYAEGDPRAAEGVRAGLLGTTRRRDGRRQVTYRGQPLYFYAHEKPGQVLCQNVSEFGGLWLVVSPEGPAIRS